MTDAPGRETPATFQIGEVAERIGLSQRTIRHYDDLGIVKPSARTAGGFRLYTDADVQRFLLIKPFKPLGIGLEMVRTLLEALDVLATGERDPHAEEVVEEVLKNVAARRAELDEALAASVNTVAALERALDATRG